MEKMTAMLSPPSSPTPKKSKKKRQATVSPDGRGGSPKHTSGSPKSKRIPAAKVDSGKKKPSNSANKRKRRRSSVNAANGSVTKPMIEKSETNNSSDRDRNDTNFQSEEKRKRKRQKRKINKNSTVAASSESAPVVVENDNVITKGMGRRIESPTKKDKTKSEDPVTFDAHVHRLRHMGYIPGSVSAFTPTSTKDGQVVVARTDGSYELKSITSSSSVRQHYSGNNHRLITIAETSPVTGGKSNSDDCDDDSNIDDIDNEVSGPCADAASSLCWLHTSSTPICVGSGPNGNIWIVNFKHSRPTSVVSSGGGGIFDITTCKFHGDAAVGKSLPLVAGACEDGSVRIWRVTPGSDGQGKIQDFPLVTLPSASAPVLSLAWKNVAVLKQGRTTTFQTVVFAAVADGTIRKYSLDIEEENSKLDNLNEKGDHTGGADSHNFHYSIPNLPKSILRMTIESKGRKESTKVWTLLLLSDNTLVAGTSLGQVQFWNGDMGTLTQTIIQSNSKADVLKIVVNSDETKLFCSGVDSRVVCLERRKPPINKATPQPESELTALFTSHLTTYRPWKMTISHRPHTHDVKAMSVVTSSSNVLSSSIEILLTGGLDTKICSYSVSKYAHTQPQTWYPWPGASSLFSSTSYTPKGCRKLVSMQHHDRIEIYQLETLKNKTNQSKYLKQNNSQFPTSIPVGTIKLGGSKIHDDESMISPSSSSPLQASSLSPNGKFLAVSNSSSTYVFKLNWFPDKTNDEISMRLKPEKVELPKELQNVSATTFLFANDELYVADSSSRQKVHILRLPAEMNDADDNCMDVEEEKDDGNKILCVQTVSIPQLEQSNISKEVLLPIQSLHANGNFLVTSCHARENAIHIFRRRSSKKNYKHFWTLPKLGDAVDARPAAIAILDRNRLAVATYRSHLYLLDIETRSLNQWSEQYGYPIKEKKWTEDSLCDRGYPLRLIPQQNGNLIMVSLHSIYVCFAP